MVAAEEKWPDIGERISCVGHSSSIAGNGGGRMDGGAESSNAGQSSSSGGGWGVMNSWPIPSRMASNLCYKEGHPSSRQAAALYTTARTRKHTTRMPDSHSQKKGTVITARGSCASPRKLYYTLKCGGWRDVPPHHFQVQEGAAFHSCSFIRDFFWVVFSTY